MRPDVLAGGLLAFVCLVVLVAIVVVVFYNLTLQKALSRVAPHNRLMEPGLVWLDLIPFFNIVWNFFIATRIPDSLRNEFRDRGMDDSSDYGRGIGLAYAIIVVALIPLSSIVNASGSGPLLLITGAGELGLLVLFIVFWVRIAGYSSQLAAGSYRRRDRDYDDDYEDDYPDRAPPERGPDRGPPDAIRPDDRDRYTS